MSGNQVGVDEQLQDKTDVFRTAFECSRVGEALVAVAPDVGTRLVAVNRALAETLGYSQEQLLGMSVAELAHPEDLEAVRAEMSALLAGGQQRSSTVIRFLGADRRVIHAVLSVSLVRSAAGGPEFAIWHFQDLTEERRAAAELADRDRRLRAAFDSALDAMMVADDERRWIEVNGAACELFGAPREALLGRRLEEFTAVSKEVIAQQWAEFLKAGQENGELEIVRVDDEARLVEFSLKANFLPSRHLFVLRDVTERKRSDEARELARDEAAQLAATLNQAQKLETVGQLAGGIAHDFNNLLAVILHSSDFALGELGDHPVAQEVEEIRAAAQRAATLTRQLLAMSRPEISNPKTLDLNKLVAGVGRLLRRTIGEHIELEASLDPQLSQVVADPGQLEQVLLNLALNARDAMPTGGVLSVQTSSTTVDEDAARLRPDIVPGTYVVLSVSDTGTGMSEAVRRRALEPFFTTKATGSGSGLGLATAYGMVKAAGGYLEIVSEVDVGTTLRIHLPAATDHAVATPSPPAPSAPDGRGQRVLVVEDEDGVRRVTERILRTHGYDVICAVGPEHALALDPGQDVDVILTDIVMPGMSGPDLIEQLKERWPGAGIVYMSGYTPSPPATGPGVRFLSKPFDKADLVRHVAAALPETRRSA